MAGHLSLRALLRDERGVSIIELGLMAPILGVLLLSSIDLGRGLSERFLIQQAAHRALELVNARNLAADREADEIDFTFVKTEAAEAAGVPIGQVELTRKLECEGDEQDPGTETCAAGEQTARYIELTIRNNFEPMFDLAGVYPRANADGTIPIVVQASVRIQ